MSKPVIAIGLDSADYRVVDKYIADGHLENLARLREDGAYGHLENFEEYTAELPWTTFTSGCAPAKTGYYSALKFCEGSYELETQAAYDYADYAPFYALGDDYRVAVFDLPHTQLSEGVNGLQLLAWGTHSPQHASGSLPASLFQEVVDKHGPNPSLHRDFAEALDLEGTQQMRERMMLGLKRRISVCCDLLDREPWDLFLTVFSEPHTAGHHFWHLSLPDHPLYPDLGGALPGDPMLETYKLIDEGIGRMLERAPADAHVVVFSAHGMAANSGDLPSNAFLPETLFRLSFPGEKRLGASDETRPPGPQQLETRTRSWVWDVWTSQYDPNPLRRLIRRKAPWGLYKHIERFLGLPQPDLIPPWRLRETSDAMPQMPPNWYRPFWPHMRAFALPSFSQGYIRVNLKGREPNGVVEPEEYDAFCDDLIEKVQRLTDARSGNPLVKRAFRTRSSAADRDPKLPDPDIIVIWREGQPTDVAFSPEVGRIGPIPHQRAGAHSPTGFMMARGPGVQPGHRISGGHSLDLGPTILGLMGAPIADHFDGKPLLNPQG